MNFDSIEYLFFFLPAVLFLYHVTRKRLALSNAVILSASYVFYAWGHAWVVLLLIFSSVTDYYIGHAIDRSATQTIRKRLLILSCVFNLGLLSVFKYGNWVSEALNHAWPLIPVLALPLPHGISFYTFQSLSYTIDIYRRRLKPQGTMIDYLAFVSFFPHLVAGPILKAIEVLPQLERIRSRVSPRNAEKAVFMIVWGLFKKMVLADNLGQVVEMTRGNLGSPGAGLILALAFTFQIYCDFSAYSDIARGSARLFGIRIPRNFWTPYFSLNPSEFWQRWHISLSSWIRDYLYIPLGGSQHGRGRTLANLLLTMLLAGLWHGAGKFFIFWGLYHGVLLILYRVFPIDQLLIRRFGRSIGSALAWLVMFGFTVWGWIIFFAHKGSEYKAITYSLMAVAKPWRLTPEFGQWCWGLALFTLPVVVTEIIGYRHKREFVDVYPALPAAIKCVLYVIIFYALVFFAARDSYAFIYFRF